MRHFIFIVVIAAAAATAADPHYRSNFATGRGEWVGWSATGPVNVATTHDKTLGKTVLEFTIADPAPRAWNVPLLDKLKPFTVTSRTMIRFQVRAENSIDNELTFFDETEGAEYSVFFPTRAGEYVTIQKYLFKAAHKRGGKPETLNDGLLGDRINGFRIATCGKNIRIADIEIFEAENEAEMPADTAQEALDAYLTDYRVPDYPVLRRNSIFPYGAVTRIDAIVSSSGLFERPIRESLHDDLVDMRRHYLNTYLNFCEKTPLELRLELAEETGIRLIETMFCATDFSVLPADDPGWRAFETAKRSPALLAWYGQDEPLPSAYPAYLANKKKIMELDSLHPLTSALHLGTVRQQLGATLEVMVPDIYSLGPNTPADGKAITEHFKIIRLCRNQTAGKRVWFMTQSFSNRHPRGNKAEFSKRFPTVVEMRLDLYTSAAAGASGILFFLYNDHATILDGTLRGEEFDRTLVDPWGNGNPVYDEISEFGRRIVPILPSFLDAEPVNELPISAAPALLVGQLRNDFGTMVVFVNRSTSADYRGVPMLKLPEGKRLYRLESLEQATAPKLHLRPGEGELYLVATPEQFRVIATEIKARREAVAADLAALRRAELDAAGFSGEASSEWLAAEKELVGIRQAFGELYAYLTKPDLVFRVEIDPTFKPLLEKLKQLSRSYFTLRRAHRTGKIPEQTALSELRNDLKKTDELCRKMVRAK